MTEYRPNPEKLLQRVQEEELKEQRGKLKIYLGAAPGVGKTYTMLQDAIAKRAQGLDVVIGIVESHNRQEIEAMLNSFEIIPRQIINYHGKEIQDFDLDAALTRNPGLILVDEMAHTNAPNMRHTKRWQDIKELLDRGCDVYTTLNVQHIESLNDVVSQIIHTRIKETIPDSMLELADTIELVDLPPEDLLTRLHEGKVYFPEQAKLAVEHFFRKGNLIALREIALRITAERVGAQVLLYRQGQGIKHIWPTKEKLLVCVGSGEESTKVIRAAYRMASSLKADWIAIHVDAPRLRYTEEQRNAAIQHLRLAEKLGAETRIVTGCDIVSEIIGFARERNVTKIVMWKHIRPRLRGLFYRSLVDELVRHSGEIDVYIITSSLDQAKSTKSLPSKREIAWRVYGIAIAIVSFATLINYFLSSYMKSSNLIMVYLLSVTLSALFGRMGPAILASILSVLAYDFFFIPPIYSFALNDIEYFFTLIVMLFVTMIISHLTILTQRQAQAARLSERRTAALHTLSRQLAHTRGTEKLLNVAVRYLSEAFDSEILALLPVNNHLAVKARYRSSQKLSEKEKAVAQWVFDLGEIAGLGTDTLPFSDAIYIPLFALKGTIGVLRVRPFKPEQLFTPEQMQLLEDCANQIALSVEVDRIHDHKKNEHGH